MSEKRYRCIKEFQIPLYDSETDGWTDEEMAIKKDSVWSEDNGTKIIDGEIRLENDNTGEWIEITKERLDECFEEIESEKI